MTSGGANARSGGSAQAHDAELRDEPRSGWHGGPTQYGGAVSIDSRLVSVPPAQPYSNRDVISGLFLTE
jgi:hypothetical protein